MVRWLGGAVVFSVLMSLAGAAHAAGEAPDSVPRSQENGSYQDDDYYGDEPEDYFGARRFRITASTGVDYSTGDFGGPTDTDLLYVPFGLKFEWDPIVLKLTVPYLRIDGDVVPVGGQPEPVPGVSGVRDGLGDIVLAATYVYYPGVDFLPLTELTGKVKFGTADEDDGLGTGENDYTLQLDLSKRFGRVTPFGAAGYKFIGEPSGVSLRNKIFAYGGATVRVTDRMNLGLVYDWSQSSVRDRSDFHELSPFATFRFGRHFAIDPYFVVGLSESAPDWGAGMQLRFIYDRE
jgi:opacity protein-like surface antigen